jgi:hypothetical protein
MERSIRKVFETYEEAEEWRDRWYRLVRPGYGGECGLPSKDPNTGQWTVSGYTYGSCD